jgi:ABC-type Zn uptake system ZnuABC Zn-binding protein ZnuA
VTTARRAAIALLTVLAVHPAAWAGQTAGSGAPLAVVTTSTDLRALVEAVGGRRVQVDSLAPPLADPHAVEVKPGQLARLKAASLLVRIGLDHEPWLGRVLKTLGDARWRPGSPNYLDVSRGITLLQAETPRVREERGPHVHGFGNTHYWLDPENARPMTQAILEALTGLSPADRAAFEECRAGFLGDLDAGLTRWRASLAPYRGSRVVVVHETWPYFAQRFGLTVVAALESTPGVPPTPSHLAALIQQMRQAGVKVLIAEPYANASVVQQVAGRSGARVATLVPSVGGDPEAGDYLALFDLNVKRLTEAFAAKSQ